MEKHDEYKDALFIRDNIRYCAKLPDIKTYTFLNSSEAEEMVAYENKISDKPVEAYTPKMMQADLKNNVIPLPFVGYISDAVVAKTENNADDTHERTLETLAKPTTEWSYNNEELEQLLSRAFNEIYKDEEASA